MKNNLKEFIEIQKAINLIEKKSDITKKRNVKKSNLKVYKKSFCLLYEDRV